MRGARDCLYERPLTRGAPKQTFAPPTFCRRTPSAGPDRAVVHSTYYRSWTSTDKRMIPHRLVVNATAKGKTVGLPWPVAFAHTCHSARPAQASRLSYLPLAFRHVLGSTPLLPLPTAAMHSLPVAHFTGLFLAPGRWDGLTAARAQRLSHSTIPYRFFLLCMVDVSFTHACAARAGCGRVVASNPASHHHFTPYIHLPARNCTLLPRRRRQ